MDSDSFDTSANEEFKKIYENVKNYKKDEVPFFEKFPKKKKEEIDPQPKKRDKIKEIKDIMT